MRLGRAELSDALHALPVVDRDVVEADRGVVALVNRTKYFIVPESSIPACSDFE